MSSDAISKNKLVVQDDFFNEIVGGLKSPVEEKIETQDAKSSRVELGGKQLTLFKDKVAPIFGKEIGKNQMVHDYMQHVSDSYEKKKIHQIHEEYVAALKDLSGFEREIDDEIDDIQRDKKGQEMFLFQGFKLFKTIRRIMSFYNMIGQMKAQIQSSDDTNKIILSNYNIENNDQRNALYNDVSVKMIEQGLRFVPVMRPVLYSVTQSIFDAAPGAFRKINNAIYWELTKIIGQAALEYGAATVLTFFTQGRGAVAFQMATMNLMRRITQVVSVGSKLARVVTRAGGSLIARMGAAGGGLAAAGRGLAAAGRGAAYVGRGISTVGRGVWGQLTTGTRRVGRYVRDNPRAALSQFRWAVRGFKILDILDVDEDDLNEVKQWARREIAPYRRVVEEQWQVVSRDISTGQSIVNSFRGITSRVIQDLNNGIYQMTARNVTSGQEMRNETFRLSYNLEQKYDGEVYIENLNFDFSSFGRLNDFFNSVASSNYQMNLEQFLVKEGSKIKFGRNLSFEYDTIGDYLRWQITDINNEITTSYISPEMLQRIKKLNVTGKWYILSRDEFRFPVEVEKELTSIDINVGGFTNTLKTTYTEIENHTLSRKQTERYIRLKEEVANKGVEFRFAKFGIVTGVRFYFQFNPHFFKDYRTNEELPDEWLDSVSFMERIRGYITSMTQQEKIYLYKNGKKIDNIDGINIVNNRDYIDINGFNSNIKKYVIAKKTSSEGLIPLEYIQSEDLHEIGDFHNTLLEQEIEYGKNLEKFKKAIEEELTGMYSLRQSVIKAINDENTRIQQPTTSYENHGSVYIRTYQYFDFKSTKEVEDVVSRMRRDELNAIINSQNRDQMRDILRTYGIRLMTVRKETKLPNIAR